jgi:hypothetical protein
VADWPTGGRETHDHTWVLDVLQVQVNNEFNASRNSAPWRMYQGSASELRNIFQLLGRVTRRCGLSPDAVALDQFGVACGNESCWWQAGTVRRRGSAAG